MKCLLYLLLGTTTSIAWWDLWPNEEHQAMISRSVDICAERFPEMAAEITACRSRLMAGAHDEDFDSDEVNGSYCDYSGYCPALPRAWWPTARRPLNALQWVHDPLNPNNWSTALNTYQSSKNTAYYMLGHIIHNLQDLFVPAHSHISPHGTGTAGLVENHSWPGYFDKFEQWCEVTEAELSLAQASRIPDVCLESLMVRAARFSATDNDTAGFRPSEYYAPPDTIGGWGRYRPYPSGGYPCGRDRIDNNLANRWSRHLVPACCEYGAGAIRQFYLAANPQGATESSDENLGRSSTVGTIHRELGASRMARLITPDGRTVTQPVAGVYLLVQPGGRYRVVLLR